MTGGELASLILIGIFVGLMIRFGKSQPKHAPYTKQPNRPDYESAHGAIAQGDGSVIEHIKILYPDGLVLALDLSSSGDRGRNRQTWDKSWGEAA